MRTHQLAAERVPQQDGRRGHESSDAQRVVSSAALEQHPRAGVADPPAAGSLPFDPHAAAPEEIDKFLMDCGAYWDFEPFCIFEDKKIEAALDLVAEREVLFWMKQKHDIYLAHAVPEAQRDKAVCSYLRTIDADLKMGCNKDGKLNMADRNHPLKDGKKSRCEDCHGNFESTAAAHSHYTSRRHLAQVLGEGIYCFLCKKPIGWSVMSHLSGPDHGQMRFRNWARKGYIDHDAARPL